MSNAVANLSDDDVMGNLRTILSRGHKLLTGLLLYLGEVEERRLHLKDGYPSMHKFCVRKLGMSEGEAARRIRAARLARRYPLVLEVIERGDIHLCALSVIYPYVKDHNQRELIEAASRKTKWQVEELIAARFPKADVAARIRKLPTQRTQSKTETQTALLIAASPALSTPAPATVSLPCTPTSPTPAPAPVTPTVSPVPISTIPATSSAEVNADDSRQVEKTARSETTRYAAVCRSLQSAAHRRRKASREDRAHPAIDESSQSDPRHRRSAGVRTRLGNRAARKGATWQDDTSALTTKSANNSDDNGSDANNRERTTFDPHNHVVNQVEAIKRSNDRALGASTGVRARRCSVHVRRYKWQAIRREIAT